VRIIVQTMDGKYIKEMVQDQAPRSDDLVTLTNQELHMSGDPRMFLTEHVHFSRVKAVVHNTDVRGFPVIHVIVGQTRATYPLVDHPSMEV